MTKYLASRPDIAEVMARSMKMTRPELIAQMERDPQAMAIATKHGLNARDYTYGVPALRMALLAAQGLTGPSIIASPENVAFAKTNLAELKPKMDAMDGGGGHDKSAAASSRSRDATAISNRPAGRAAPRCQRRDGEARGDGGPAQGLRRPGL